MWFLGVGCMANVVHGRHGPWAPWAPTASSRSRNLGVLWADGFVVTLSAPCADGLQDRYETHSEQRRVHRHLAQVGSSLAVAKWHQQLLLSFAGGCFIAIGAALSVVLSDGVSIHSGPQRILQAFGFLAGFVLVVLSGAALFTEYNVILPHYLLSTMSARCFSCIKFWGLSWLGNLCGAFFVSVLISASGVIGSTEQEVLVAIMQTKIPSTLTALSWFQVVLSGCIGNWLVGMAFLFASRPQRDNVVQIIVALFFPILAFVSLGVQHAPANMGYGSLLLVNAGIRNFLQPAAVWQNFFLFSLIPASIGNVVGAFLLVTLFWTVAVAKDPSRPFEPMLSSESLASVQPPEEDDAPLIRK